MATLSESRTEMTEILLPNQTNSLGRALGGVVLHWMDICAAVANMRFAGEQCVTASMDHVDFISPIDLGEVVIIEGYVFETGTTSIETRVDVHAEDPIEGEKRSATRSFFTFVALDADGHPTAVPPLECPTEAGRKRRKEALKAREAKRR